MICFISHVESLGFVKASGTYSDINHISPAWQTEGGQSLNRLQTPAQYETLNIKTMFEIILKVKEMLDDSNNINESFK